MKLGGGANFTPLMAACCGAHNRIVEFLLSLGVRLNDRDERGRTAFDIICRSQEPPDLAPEIIQRRIKMGISVGHPPKRLEAIAAMLRQAGAKTGKS